MEIRAGFHYLFKIRAGGGERQLAGNHVHAHVAVGRCADQGIRGQGLQRVFGAFTGHGGLPCGEEQHVRAVIAELGAHLAGNVIVDCDETGEDGRAHGDGQQGDQHTGAAAQERGRDHPKEHFSFAHISVLRAALRRGADAAPSGWRGCSRPWPSGQ